MENKTCENCRFYFENDGNCEPELDYVSDANTGVCEEFEYCEED